MTATGAIARLHIRVWFNGVARALESRRAAYGVVAAVAGLLLTWVVFGTISFSSQLDADLDGVQYLVEPLTATMVEISAMAALFASVYSMGDTLINNLLAVMPINPRDRSFATRWLATTMGFTLGAIWSFPLIFQYVRVLSTARMIVVSVSCLTLLVVGPLLAQILMSILELSLSIVLRSPKIVHAISSAGAALLLTWAFLLAIPVGRRQAGEGPISILAVPLFWAVRDSLPYVLMVPVYLGVAVVLILILRCLDGVPRVRMARVSKLNISAHLVEARTLVGLEIRQWLRFPANGVFLLFLAIIAGVVMILWGSSLSEAKWYALAYLFVALASTLGVGAYGATRPFHWLYPVTGRPLAWVLPKLLATLLLWLTSVGVLFSALALLTTWNFFDGWNSLPILLLELVIGSITGLILPVSQEQSLGSSLSETVAITIVFSIAVGVQSVTWPDSLMVTAGIYLTSFSLLIAIYFFIARYMARTDLTS